MVHHAIRGQTRPARSDHAVGAAPGPNAIRSDLPVLGQMSHGICRALVGVLHGHERAAAGVRHSLGARKSPAAARFVPDSPLEGIGFELSVPRQMGNGFEALSETGPIGYRRRGLIRAVAGLAESPD